MTPTEALEVMQVLSDCFPGRVPPTAVRVWAMAVEQYDAREVASAVARVARECEHPSLASVVERLGDLKPKELAIHAFDDMRKAISKHGMYRSVDFCDRGINAALRAMGGWVRVCMMPEEEFNVWGRKEFERVYAVYSASGASEGEMGEYLAGIAETSNSGRGYPAEPPVKIGAPRTRPKGLPPEVGRVVRRLTPGAKGEKCDE